MPKPRPFPGDAAALGAFFVLTCRCTHTPAMCVNNKEVRRSHQSKVSSVYGRGGAFLALPGSTSPAEQPSSPRASLVVRPVSPRTGGSATPSKAALPRDVASSAGRFEGQKGTGRDRGTRHGEPSGVAGSSTAAPSGLRSPLQPPQTLALEDRDVVSCLKRWRVA